MHPAHLESHQPESPSLVDAMGRTADVQNDDVSKGIAPTYTQGPVTFAIHRISLICHILEVWESVCFVYSCIFSVKLSKNLLIDFYWINENFC